MYETLCRVDDRLQQLATRFEAMPEQVKDHEHRIRTLEMWRGKAAGIAAVVSLVVGPLATFVVQKIGG